MNISPTTKWKSTLLPAISSCFPMNLLPRGIVQVAYGFEKT